MQDGLLVFTKRRGHLRVGLPTHACFSFLRSMLFFDLKDPTGFDKQCLPAALLSTAVCMHRCSPPQLGRARPMGHGTFAVWPGVPAGMRGCPALIVQACMAASSGMPSAACTIRWRSRREASPNSCGQTSWIAQLGDPNAIWRRGAALGEGAMSTASPHGDFACILKLSSGTQFGDSEGPRTAPLPPQSG